MAFCITNVTAIAIIDDGVTGPTCLTSTSNNIGIIRGSTFTLIFDLKDGVDPADLDGYSINAVIKPSSTSNTELLFMSTQNRMIDINYDTARVTVNIPVKHTSRLPLGAQYYFIRLINSGGNTQKIIQGIATVSDS